MPMKLAVVIIGCLYFACVGCSASLWAGIVGLERQDPDIGAWALEFLQQNQNLFDESSRLYSEGKLVECREALSKLRESNKALPQPDLVIVWLLLSDRKLEDAKARLESLAALVPRDPQVTMTLGQVAIAEQRFADAAAQLERAALLQLPEAWTQKQRSDFAFQIFRCLAITYERQGRWADLKPILGSLIRLDHQNPSYLVRLALAHFNLSETKEAEALLENAARMTGGATPPQLLLAEVAFCAGRLPEAEAAINEARKIHNSNFNVHLWHAEWKLFHADCAEAEASLATAQRLGTSSSRFWVPQGQMHLMKGEYSQAVQAFRKALSELANENDRSREVAISNLLAIALTCSQQDLGNIEAISIAEKNAVKHATDPFLVGSLGWIYLKSGRHDEAKQLLTRAAQISNQISSDLSYFLAEFYYSANEPSIAKPFLQGAMEGTTGIFLMKASASELAAQHK